MALAAAICDSCPTGQTAGLLSAHKADSACDALRVSLLSTRPQPAASFAQPRAFRWPTCHRRADAVFSARPISDNNQKTDPNKDAP